MRASGLEALVAAIGENQMIDDRNPDEHADPDQALGGGDILRARVKVAAGVVVAHDDPRGSAHDGGLEHLARVDQASRECSDGHRLDSHRNASRIQVNDLKMLPVIGARTFGDQLEGVFGALDRLRLNAARPITYHDDPNLAHTAYIRAARQEASETLQLRAWVRNLPTIFPTSEAALSRARPAKALRNSGQDPQKRLWEH